MHVIHQGRILGGGPLGAWAPGVTKGAPKGKGKKEREEKRGKNRKRRE